MAVKTGSQPLVKLLQPIMIILLLVLAAEFALLGFFPSKILGGENKGLLTFDVSTGEILPKAPLDSFQESVDKNLFSPDRKPVVAGVTPVQRSTEKGAVTDRWVLSGVVNTGDKIYAIFASVNLDVRLRLEAGMYLEKWKIQTIESDRVTVGEGDDKFEFFMRELQQSPDKKAAPRRPSARSNRSAEANEAQPLRARPQ